MNLVLILKTRPILPASIFVGHGICSPADGLMSPFHDVIRLDALGIYAEGLMSNQISAEQIPKIAERAKRLGGGRIVYFPDNNEAGIQGAKETLVALAAHCDVRLGWSGEQFAGREPERRIGRVLKSTVLGHRRVTADVMILKESIMNKDNICIHCGGTGRDVPNGICPMCMATVSYGTGENKKEVHVAGTRHEEVMAVANGLVKEKTKHPFLKLLVNYSFAFGSLLALLGVVLVVLGSSGETEFTFFGQTFKSQNIGIASFFLGAVLIVLNVRRILKSYDRN